MNATQPTSLQTTDGKATMVLINTIGYPVVRQIKITKSEIDDQRKSGLVYGDITLRLHYIEKGKRKPCGFKFNSKSTIAIFDGWHNVTIPNEITACDHNLYEQMKSQINTKPIFEINENSN